MERHVRVSFLKVAIIKGPAKLFLRKFSFKIEVSVVLQITGHSKNGPLNRRNNFFFSRQLIFCLQMLLTVEERN